MLAVSPVPFSPPALYRLEGFGPAEVADDECLVGTFDGTWGVVDGGWGRAVGVTWLEMIAAFVFCSLLAVEGLGPPIVRSDKLLPDRDSVPSNYIKKQIKWQDFLLSNIQ